MVACFTASADGLRDLVKIASPLGHASSFGRYRWDAHAAPGMLIREQNIHSRYKFDSSLSIKAHLGNKYLLIGIGAVALLQLLFTYALPFQELFETKAIPSWIWPRLLPGGLVFFLVVEAKSSSSAARDWRAPARLLESNKTCYMGRSCEVVQSDAAQPPKLR